MLRRLYQPLLRLALLSLLVGLIPPAASTTARAPTPLPAQPAAPAAVVAAPSQAPLMVLPSPSDAGGSTWKPASHATSLRQQYGGRHAINGVFDGGFNTERRLIAEGPALLELNVNNLPPNHPQPIDEEILPLPPGLYQSVDFQLSTGSNNVQVLLSVRVSGTTTWSHEEWIAEGPNLPESPYHITFGWALPPVPTAIDVRLRCIAFAQAISSCTFRDLRFATDNPDWHFVDAGGNIQMPTIHTSCDGQFLAAAGGFLLCFNSRRWSTRRWQSAKRRQ